VEPVSRSLSVPFRGDGAGNYPLSWSQRWILRVSSPNATDLQHRHMTTIVPVPSGRDVDTVRQAVSTLLADHQSLRTSFHIDEHGQPRQVVVGEGEVVAKVADVETPDPQREEIDRLAEALARAPYTASELAVRLLIVIANEMPTHVILAVSHLSTDAWAIRVVKGDLARIMDGADDEDERRRRRAEQLSDRVAYENSAEGVRYSARSIEHWKEQVSHFPPRDYLPSRSLPESPRFSAVSMHSDAVGTAAQILSARLRVGPSAVFIGLAAVLLAQRSGASRASFLVVCHNRFASSASALLGPLVQDFPLTVEVGGHPPEELLRVVHASVIDGAFSAQYDPGSLHAMLDDLTRSRGVHPDLSYVVNVYTNTSGSRSGRGRARPLTGHDLRTLAQSTKLREDVAREQTGINFYLSTALRGGGATVLLRTNTAYLSKRDTREFLGDLEHLGVAWADQVR
jgi:hypothetical protein